MAEFYEIVVFTAAIEEYANFILDILDSKRCISHKLYRQHTYGSSKLQLKDLSKLGRELDKVIIIDNLPDNFQKQPMNGIYIKSWYGEEQDFALVYLAPILKRKLILLADYRSEIVVKKCSDVRAILKSLKLQMIDNIEKNISNPYINLYVSSD